MERYGHLLACFHCLSPRVLSGRNIEYTLFLAMQELFNVVYQYGWSEDLKNKLVPLLKETQPYLVSSITQVLSSGYHYRDLVQIMMHRSALQYLHDEMPEIAGDVLYSKEVENMDRTIDILVCEEWFFSQNINFEYVIWLDDSNMATFTRLVNAHPWWYSTIKQLIQDGNYQRTLWKAHKERLRIEAGEEIEAP